jgi:curved DNA-binding protein CbpA
METAESDSYVVLGIDRSASRDQIKTAYRDLCRVWHPDRFGHDVRLQALAEEKLKEINQAYELIKSGRASVQRNRPAARSAPARHRDALARRSQSIAVFAGILLFIPTSYLILNSTRSKNPGPLLDDQASSVFLVAPSSDETRKSNTFPPANIREQKVPSTQKQDPRETDISGGSLSAAPVRALPTVTVSIDPATMMLATASCPSRTRMTYPEGTEPKEFCRLHNDTKADSDTSGDNGSRLKRMAAKVKSAGKLFKRPAENAP